MTRRDQPDRFGSGRVRGGASRWAERAAVRPLLVYTAGRILVLVAVAGLLWFAGLNGLLLAAAAVLLSLPLSYVLLARQRVALGLEIERRVQRRRSRRADLRAQLRGQDADEGP